MSDRTRKVTFAGAAALLAGLVPLLDAHGSAPADRSPPHAASGAVIERTPAPTAPTVQPTATHRAPARSTARREREPRRAPAIAPGERCVAATAARVFLRAYLLYSYGRAGADRIRAAAPPLAHALREAPPRVPAAVARARPRLGSVTAQAATGVRDVLIVATVEDGRRRYDLRLTVHHGADGWVVTEISG